jgi:hypothetical protein
MKKIIITPFLFIIIFLFGISSCDWFKNCSVNPDLITELLAPATTIIQGETVEWDYIIESVEENSEDCDILLAVASVSRFAIDYFINQNDNNGQLILNKQANINELEANETQIVSENIDVFNNEGIYLISSTADVTDLVTERDENNNNDEGEFDIEASADDIFANASENFKEKLSKSGAIVIIGRSFNNGNRIYTYNGKPIYYAD